MERYENETISLTMNQYLAEGISAFETAVLCSSSMIGFLYAILIQVLIS